LEGLESREEKGSRKEKGKKNKVKKSVKIRKSAGFRSLPVSGIFQNPAGSESRSEGL
jgi:hypothetical protein